MAINFINLTPHAITFVNSDNKPFCVVAPSGDLARVSTKTVTVGEVEGIPVTQTEYGEVEGLPEPKKDTIYLVSSLVAQRCTGREDVFIPNESVRDSEGRIVGCRSLGRI